MTTQINKCEDFISLRNWANNRSLIECEHGAWVCLLSEQSSVGLRERGNGLPQTSGVFFFFFVHGRRSFPEEFSVELLVKPCFGLIKSNMNCL